MSSNPIIRVSVQLLKPEEGGRPLLQVGHYRPHICFDNTSKLWAIELSIHENTSYNTPTIMEGTFLFSNQWV